jgi:hypothetical protein
MVLYPLVLSGFLFIYTIIGKYVNNILTTYELYEMVISTVLLLLLSYARSSMLELSGDSIAYASILCIAYVNWYFITKLIINRLNKENVVGDTKGIPHTF